MFPLLLGEDAFALGENQELSQRNILRLLGDELQVG